MVEDVLCPCGSGALFRECHGGVAAEVRSTAVATYIQPATVASYPETPGIQVVRASEEKPGFVELDDIKKHGLGFQRVEAHHGSTYRDRSTFIIVPARDQFFHHRIVASWGSLIKPMNQPTHMQYVIGDEVGVAYDSTIKAILANPMLSKWKYVMTMETDNLQPPDAIIRLQESIEKFGLDGVSGLYWTKGEYNMPMAYGDPADYRRTGVLDFKPLDIRRALDAGEVVEVNGIAMGCSLYKMELFREIEPPWFQTLNDLVPGQGAAAMTQDLFFCRKAREKGKRFGVDMRVRVGHLDFESGVVY